MKTKNLMSLAFAAALVAGLGTHAMAATSAMTDAKTAAPAAAHATVTSDALKNDKLMLDGTMLNKVEKMPAAQRTTFATKREADLKAMSAKKRDALAASHQKWFNDLTPKAQAEFTAKLEKVESSLTAATGNNSDAAK